MRKRQWVGLVAAAIGLAAGPVGHAEGFYFAISGGISNLDLAKSDGDAIALAGAEAAVAAVAEDGIDLLVDDDFDSSLDDSGKVWGLQVGYQWNRYVGAELGYVHLGQGTYKADILYTDLADEPVIAETYKVRFRSNGPTLAAVGFLPLGDRFDLLAKAGVYFSDTRVQERSTAEDFDISVQREVKDRAEDLFAGIGAAWNISDGYALRVEYQRFFDVGDDDTGEFDVDVVTLSVLFR